jgi:TetR/AcrR family transcriptional regulator, transcriptional repressor for nem operon
MARTKEFDENEVLEKAVELFRRRGFQSTSFGEMTAELGVNRQSLYDTFGDKQSFFIAALKRYGARAIDQMRRILSTSEPVRSQLRQIFDGTRNYVCSEGHYGCLMVNSMIEQAVGDAATRALVTAHAREVEGLLAQRLSAAQRAGELDRKKDPVALARFLYHTLLGMGVAARALGDRDALKQSGEIALRALD